MAFITVSGIDEIIRRVESYERKLKEKQREVLKRLASIGIETASIRFANAQYDGTNDVVVDSEPRWISDNTLQVVAHGSTVAFIEFGTGVHYADTHPKAAEFGAIRGSYGHRLGRFDSWHYEGDPGTNGEIITSGKNAGRVLTHGNPPARAMYEASKEMRKKVKEIVKEVYAQ